MRITRGIPAAAHSPVALTIGNFDGVHLGHRAMLDELARAARRLNVPACVMIFEPQPREFFAPDQAPARLTSLREKLELLAQNGVDRAHVCRFNYAFAQIAAQDFIERVLVAGLGVRWLQVGDDFRFGARRAGDFGMLEHEAPRLGYEVQALPSVMVEGIRVSSTAVRDALAAGDCARAARLLGRSYSISGRVVRGDQLGRKLGFPTANVQMKHNRAPLAGIFAVEVHGAKGAADGAADGVVRGAANVGVRPTVKAQGEVVLEVYLFDFKEEIYGRHVQVDFLHKLRDEETYADLETLKRQIAVDVENAKAYFAAVDSHKMASG
jgi:riboflavin kinase / FMN adenylyltransferase